jgi:hypothetical protein
MQKKAAPIKLEDSNLANYGSQMHTDAKLAKAQAELEFKGAGAAEGIEVWRVENFGVKKWPRDQYGSFFDGDSYIVLNTYKLPGKIALAYNVHFWLGKDSSQDEMGTAAFKTVELDDLLGDLPVQYREVQGYESTEFMNCFGGNITLMSGGVPSAFKNVKPKDYKPRLMHFKGQKKIRCTQVDCKLSSLNKGDVFLLDLGLTLIQWNGHSSSPKERRGAMEMIVKIKNDRNGKPASRLIEGDDDDDQFWEALGGKGTIAEADNDDHKAAPVPPKLFHVSDASGSMQVQQVAEGKKEMKYDLLDNDDVFILDLNSSIYVWVGSGANSKERSQAMKVAVNFLVATGRPNHTPIVRVMAGGGETPAFKKNFVGAPPSM